MTAAAKFPVILPSETQTREFDAKLLLACHLAERGHPVYVGSRVEIHNRINTFPRGLYLAKDITPSQRLIFRIMDKLGFGIVAWDEEAIVYSDAKTYHFRRVDPENLKRIKAFFALGPSNRELIEAAPGYQSTPVYETGNPRIDLLRPCSRQYFESEVNALRARFGEFILINTNFSRINHFLPRVPLKKTADGKYVNVVTTNPELWAFRRSVFEAFKALLPVLSAAFPNRQIVLRPHPTEGHETWREIARDLANVTIIHESLVHPWIIASAVAIHNGCTTGLESYMMGHPVIAYRPVISEKFDDVLSNHVSTPIFSQEELISTLTEFFAGVDLPPVPPELRQLAEERVGALNGALACERIDALIAEHGESWLAPKPSSATRMRGNLAAVGRRLIKTANSYRPGHKNSRAHSNHRFPELREEDVQARVARFEQVYGRFSSLKIRKIHGNIFCVSNQAR